MKTTAMNPGTVDHILTQDLPALEERRAALNSEIKEGTMYGEACDQELKLLNDLIAEYYEMLP